MDVSNLNIICFQSNFLVNCSSIQSLSECSNEPSCDVIGKDPWGQSCFHYINDPRGVPSFCSCQRVGGIDDLSF